MADDPYVVLGVSRGASDADVRKAYRRLVQLHHPDHNGGSEASSRRFEAVQDAYARVRSERAGGGSAGAGRSAGGATAGRGAGTAGGSTRHGDPGLDARLRAMESELRDAKRARDEARRAAREAAARAKPTRATDEELGYFESDDSFTKILSDAIGEFGDRVDEARESPAAKKVGDLIDELTSRLTGEHREE